MTKRQELRNKLVTAAKKIASKVATYIVKHVDAEERKRLLEIISDKNLTKAEIVEIAKMLLSPNQ